MFCYYGENLRNKMIYYNIIRMKNNLWSSEKFLIGQWHRSWNLQPGKTIICPCGFIIQVPLKNLPSKKRYELMYQEMEKHRSFCSKWLNL